jgi:uncharacterized protein (TIGR02611 family)
MDRIWVEGVRAARRLVVGVVGMTVLLVGLALLVLPGPAFIVIPVGLGILAVEFEWARRMFRRIRKRYAGLSRENEGRSPHAAGVSALGHVDRCQERPHRDNSHHAHHGPGRH